MADFLQLTDTPGSYSAANNKFARVNNTGTGIQFWNVTVNDLEDTITDGAYVPQTGEALIFQGDGKWKPGSLDVYSAGNGLNKVGLGYQTVLALVLQLLLMLQAYMATLVLFQ